MLGIPLFNPSKGIPPIEFNYELRCLKYVEWDGAWLIAGGDKSGKLIVFRYDGKQVQYLKQNEFGRKIISMDFVIYGQNERELGLIVALEVKENPNLFFHPNILAETKFTTFLPAPQPVLPGKYGWHEIKHDQGTPQFVFQPFITNSLQYILFSFRSRVFLIANLQRKDDLSYTLEILKQRNFTSRIIDACAEFPKNLERSRELNKKENNYIYLASKGGCILVFTFDRKASMQGKLLFFLSRIRTIHNSIRSIIPLSKFTGLEKDFRGIAGIAGTEFFCLYRPRDITTNEFAYDKKNYRLLMEHYPTSLQTLEVGIYTPPAHENEDNPRLKKKAGGNLNILMIGDSQGTLHVRQFETQLEPTDLPEILTATRTFSREPMHDRIFGIVPITIHPQKNETHSPLLQLILGLGSHEIVFKDLVNKETILDKTRKRFNISQKHPHQWIDNILEKARQGECDNQLTFELLTTLFEHQSPGNSPAMELLKNKMSDDFVQLIYRLLSSSRKSVYQYVYKKICKLIQEYNEWSRHCCDQDEEKEEHRQVYHDLDGLLTDIDKFWIGGETYSAKLADLKRLIEINQINLKYQDVLIYQANLNDRALAIENQHRIGNSELCALQLYQNTLLAADTRGYLYILKNRQGFPFLIPPINVRTLNTTIYGQHSPDGPNLDNNPDNNNPDNNNPDNNNPDNNNPDNNYIQQIVLLPGINTGLLLLHLGGIWIFPLELLKNTDTSNIFTHPLSRLIGKDIPIHSIKQNPHDSFFYLCDRLGQIYRLKTWNHHEVDILQNQPLIKTSPNAPLSDFDFLSPREVICIDNTGRIMALDLNSHEKLWDYRFPHSPRFNKCLVWHTMIITGTEEGDIASFEISSTKPMCQWTYRLPGAIRCLEWTRDQKLFIAGLSSHSVVISPQTGAIETAIHLHLLTNITEKPLESISTLLPLPLPPGEFPDQDQRLLFLAGDQQGYLKTYRLYQQKLFEKDIKDYFFSPNHPLTHKVKMRCINIHEHSLRRLFTEYEARNWNLKRVQYELLSLTLARKYAYHTGPLIFLTEKYVTLFIQSLPSTRNYTVRWFQTEYIEFQNTIKTIIKLFGLKNNYNCQMVMKTLGVQLLALMTCQELVLKFKEYRHNGDLQGFQNPRQLLEELHVHCEETTLVHIYEELRSMFQNNPHITYMDTVIDTICRQLQQHEFEPIMPEPLLMKLTDMLTFLVDHRNYCPIKLCYSILKEDSNKNVVKYLLEKIKDQNYQKVFNAAYQLAILLEKFDDISSVIKKINDFSLLFPGKFQPSTEPFYQEFLFVFKLCQNILAYSDAMTIVCAKQLEPYKAPTYWFKKIILFLNELIEKITSMKEVFQQCLDPQPQKPIPREALIHLRLYFSSVLDNNPGKQEMGDIYYRLLISILNHLETILTEFCETTLPIQALEKSATALESYLEEIRTQEKPLPALDNPDTLLIYNHHFRDMFFALIVGMQPQRAFFQYPEIINQTKLKKIDVYYYQGEFQPGETESSLIHDSYWLSGTKHSPGLEEFDLHLPDATSPEYGKYRFVFLPSSSYPSYREEKIRRFLGFVRVLNQYIMAFNSMTIAEMQSRFSHRLFAHQSKEPLISLKNLVRALQDSHFLDIDGSTTQDYYQRMMGLVEQMLKRGDFILNVRKLFRHLTPTTDIIQVKTMTDNVIKNMRKVLEESPYKGEILVENKSDELEMTIYSDESKIREILEQLIRNSIKYCRATRQIKLAIRYDKENIYFKVTDNGVGIPENELPYIFTPYYRGEYSETNNIDGDGLGLWVAKTYAGMLGGDITAKNNFDNQEKISGTAMTLNIPRQFRDLTREKHEDNHE